MSSFARLLKVRRLVLPATGSLFLLRNEMSFCTTAATPKRELSSSAKREFAHLKTASGYSPKRKLRVGVLGATGAVGQRFIEGLQDHPWFTVTRLGASTRSAGKSYGAAATWGISPDVPAYVKDAKVVTCSVSEFSKDVDFVFSALDADVAGDVEREFRDAGIPVFSNARNYRMHADVPLVVPPVNGDHLEMVRSQASFKKNGGFIVTNANCSTTGMVIALKPLEDAFGIERVFCTTLQAISGAGYPGLPSLDILDNVVPFISGEEDKLETEYAKIMGKFDASVPAPVVPASFPLSAMVNRVHVRDGHSIALSIKLKRDASPEEIAKVLENYVPAGDVSTLPSSPDHFIVVRSENNRPQPRLDRDSGRGFTTTVGRLRKDPINSVKMFVLSHNTVMGAAGSSILNAELAASKGLLTFRSE